MPALLAVVAAFMAGMALGAWRLSRYRINNAGRFYGVLEIVIGTWAAITALLIPTANRVALAWIGIESSPVRHWLVAFAIPFLVLLPATAAMGATLPVIERFVTPLTRGGRNVGALYAVNTVGAVAGVLVSTFLILPRVGLKTTTFILAGINVFCGLLAFALSRPAVDHPQTVTSRDQRLWWTLFFTGLLGIGYEIAGVRVLAQVLEGTVYTYAAVLAVFLLGTALGATIYHRLGECWELADLLCATALGGIVGVLAATRADALYQFLRRFGDSIPGVLFAEMAVAGSVFLLPTVAMGAAFTHLAQTARETHGGIGRAIAVNTIGAALAPLLFSVWLLPLVGSKWTLLVIISGYALTLPHFHKWHFAVPLGLLLLAFVPASQFSFVALARGDRVVDSREGTMASVAVVEDPMRHKTLRVDNRFQMGGTVVADAEYRHAHIPLLLHPKPQHALFLGLGTGITLGAAAVHTNVMADGVELLPEVVETMPQFSPFNEAVRTNSQMHVFVADARRFVQTTTNAYDVIVGDLFHPARDGAGSLYTLEHFRGIRARLAPGGLFCQWLPLHQLDDETFAVISRTFLEVFPGAQAWLLRFNVDTPVVGLIGSTEAITYAPDWIEKRPESPLLSERLQKLALNDSLRLFGNLLAGPVELQALSANARVNTDDNSVILFDAPRFAYIRNAAPYQRLLPFLSLDLTNVPPNLRQFITARNMFLRGLIDESKGKVDVACEHYIESARLSEDFTAGYARVLTITSAEARSNPGRSRALLERLTEAQPSRPVAKQLLEKLFPEAPR